jgi:hypothetical protein
MVGDVSLIAPANSQLYNVLWTNNLVLVAAKRHLPQRSTLTNSSIREHFTCISQCRPFWICSCKMSQRPYIHIGWLTSEHLEITDQGSHQRISMVSFPHQLRGKRADRRSRASILSTIVHSILSKRLYFYGLFRS